MSVVILHGAGGWLDEFIMFGLPLIIFGALYWWSTRQETKRKKKDADRTAVQTDK